MDGEDSWANRTLTGGILSLAYSAAEECLYYGEATPGIRVRRLDLRRGSVRTVAGLKDGGGPTANGQTARNVRFWWTHGIHITPGGDILVADTNNHRVIQIDSADMNTRFVVTSKAWFGGGADLNPCIEYPEDTAHFHAQMQAACDAHAADYYGKFKAWADEYFFIPHRGRARGVGGIFYDDLNTGNWDKDFAFTQDVGRAFLPAFVPVTERRVNTPWSDADRDAQLVHRGLYAEYNLVYDRGTKFGLETGHDANAVLMSLPPLAKWI